MTNDVSIYQAESGALEVRLGEDTVWLTQEQMGLLFDVQKAAISKHLKNVFASGELDRPTTVSILETVQLEGHRNVTRQIEHFSLDAVIAVGYRVNSVRATRFRQWATQVLHDHVTQGYTLHRERFERNVGELDAALRLVRRAAQEGTLPTDTGRGLLDIVTRYTQTFTLLQRHDEGLLVEPRTVAGGTLPTVGQARTLLAGLKADLIRRGETTDLFAQERGDGFIALLGNLEQTVLGEPAYPSVESKAAHLLYFVIKNRPFSDGNKRGGAFLFVEFLDRNGRLFDIHHQPVINALGLAALALLVAESDPGAKENIIRLVMNMLAGAS